MVHNVFGFDDYVIHIIIFITIVLLIMYYNLLTSIFKSQMYIFSYFQLIIII